MLVGGSEAFERGGDGRVSLRRGFFSARGPVGIGLELGAALELFCVGRGDIRGGVVESLCEGIFDCCRVMSSMCAFSSSFLKAVSDFTPNFESSGALTTMIVLHCLNLEPNILVSTKDGLGTQQNFIHTCKSLL